MPCDDDGDWVWQGDDLAALRARGSRPSKDKRYRGVA